MDERTDTSQYELNELCKDIQKIIKQKDYTKCQQEILEAMMEFPHSPIPHNLLGILLEKENNHNLAMKHFRAGYALDPTYGPIIHNLDIYSSFYKIGVEAYDSDYHEDTKKVETFNHKTELLSNIFGIGL